MASPADAGRATTTVSTAATTWTITLPASVAAGDLLVCLFRGSTNVISTFTGWTQLALDATDATDDQTGVYYRWSDAADPVSLVWNANTKGSAITWRITGAADPATRAPEISTVAVGTTTLNTCDPGAVTPTGGSKDYLFLACGGMDGVGAFTGAPTNYTNLSATHSTGAGAASNTSVGGASRALTAASDDPGAFTHAAATTGWTAFTVAIHPPAAAAAFQPRSPAGDHGNLAVL